MSDFKKEENGALGEARSKALLMHDFWVITRSVDADAADLIVQSSFADAETMRHDRDQPLQIASIQAKYFENDNQVNIAKEYVLNNDGKPRQGFLAFLHTNGEKRKPVHYLFNSREIIASWEKNKNDDGFFFSLKAGRQYIEFRDLNPDGIRAKVQEAIAEGSLKTIIWTWKNVASIYGTVRSPNCLDPRYRLMKIDEARIAIFRGDKKYTAHPLEPRKDVYPYFGTYSWGYPGSGTRLLAASVLTHFLCGRPHSGPR